MEPDIIDRLGLTSVGEAPHDNSYEAERVREAVDRLPDDLREVIELWVWARMRPADIAREIGCSRPAVYDRYVRALTLLGEELDV